MEMQMDAAGEIQLEGFGSVAILAYGSSYGLTRQCRPFCCALYFAKWMMTRRLCWHVLTLRWYDSYSEIAGHHFEGLQADGRYKSLDLTNRHRK